MNRFAAVKILGTILASLAQILLKISANKQYKNRIYEVVNPLVIGSYGIFFLTVFMSVYALKGISLARAAILESLSFIIIPIFSRIILKEKISRMQLYGILLIVAGIIIYNI